MFWCTQRSLLITVYFSCIVPFLSLQWEFSASFYSFISLGETPELICCNSINKIIGLFLKAAISVALATSCPGTVPFIENPTVFKVSHNIKAAIITESDAC